MKNKIINIMIILVIVVISVTVLMIVLKYGSYKINDDKMANIVAQIETIDLVQKDSSGEEKQLENAETIIEVDENATNKVTEIEIDGYKVLGIIRIPKIDIEYPILNETTSVSMKKSITKFWGPELNDIGNLTLAGHNNFDGTMFGKVKKLDIGDIIEIEDLYKNCVKYEIFKKYVIDPNDVSCVESVDSDSREVTLITCTNGNKNRLITKAREIIY